MFPCGSDDNGNAPMMSLTIENRRDAVAERVI